MKGDVHSNSEEKKEMGRAVIEMRQIKTEEEFAHLIERVRKAREHARVRKTYFEGIIAGAFLGIIVGLWTQIAVQMIDVQMVNVNWKPWVFIFLTVVLLAYVFFLNKEFSKHDTKIADFSETLNILQEQLEIARKKPKKTQKK